MVYGVSNVNFRGDTQPVEKDYKYMRQGMPYYNRRYDYLADDTLELSCKKKEEDKSVLKTAVDTVGKGIKSFVNMTVNALAMAASNVVIDKAIGKFVDVPKGDTVNK